MEWWCQLEVLRCDTNAQLFLQAGCPSCHLTNSVRALKEERRQKCTNITSTKAPESTNRQHPKKRNFRTVYWSAYPEVRSTSNRRSLTSWKHRSFFHHRVPRHHSGRECGWGRWERESWWRTQAGRPESRSFDEHWTSSCDSRTATAASARLSTPPLSTHSTKHCQHTHTRVFNDHFPAELLNYS